MANNTMDWPAPGLGSVGSYQMGGIPYVTASLTVPANSSSPLKIQFPYVAKFVTVINTGSVITPNLRVGFSSLGVAGTNYLLIQDYNKTNSEIYLDVKCSSIYLKSNTAANIAFSVAAGQWKFSNATINLGNTQVDITY